MQEPEAELQATANLSPVSPSPVHTAAPLVVPALQHTVDTIDAMVAAVAGADGGLVGDTPVDPAMDMDGEVDDIADDDSFNDAYAQEASEMAADSHDQQVPDSNDDYAKTFDSPIGSDEGDAMNSPQDVTSVPPESNDVSLQSDALTNGPTEATSHVAHDSSSAQQSVSDSSSSSSVAKPETDVEPTAITTPRPSEPQQSSSLSGDPPQTNVGQEPVSTESQSSSVDIQKLVADLTAQPLEPISNNDPNASSAKTELPAGSTSMTPSALPSSSSLPPRPPLPHTASQSYAAQHHPAGSNPSLSANSLAPPTPGQPSTYVAAGAPTSSTDAISSLPPLPSTGLNSAVPITSLNPPPYPSSAPGYPNDRQQDSEHHQRDWDQFMADERQYMSEAKWDRFPEGSRIFIGTRSASGASKSGAHIFSTGNLSSDKVSKRDVFDMFHKFGRLAQISLKSAYGFVQYHTIDEGRQALEALQGVEIKGRRIHLEISRVQDKGKKERRQSPERSRGRDGGRRTDKYSGQGRDDYRPGRNQSPRRAEYSRDDGRSRDRAYHDTGRGRDRSRSPGYGRNSKDQYRRRSPSPYGRPRHDDLDLPRRYGADVPDVQIILQSEVNRDFVAWVEGAFKAKGLKTEVMYLHPRFPKDQVIQRQAAEGVHGVIDLDLRAQSLGRIPVQAFDRSGGTSNVRFDQYVDLDPNTAAEVILRAKASGALAYNQSYGVAGGYASHAYAAQTQPTPQAGPYAGIQQAHGTYPPQHHQQPAAAAVPAAADIAKLMGQVDNATLQQLLSTIQASPQAGPHGGAHSSPPAANPQVDIQAILSSLNGNTGAQQHASAQAQYGGAYGGQPAASNGGHTQAQGRSGDYSTEVQNIMAQLARYRQ